VIFLKVSFLGPATSFSHNAALKAFPEAELVEVESIHNVFDTVESKEAEFGVVPLENSTEGSVTSTLDLLLSHNVFITGELSIRVVHCLLAKSGIKKIEKIYSHPQALSQCEKWLRKNYPKARLVGSSSTASAAEHTAKLDNAAAIASKQTAPKFGLEILEEGIQDLDFNETRFVVIGLKHAEPASNNKTTMFFALKDKPGGLFDCLKGFKDSNINLTRLESRPSKKEAWNYVFFVEFEGDRTEPRVKKAIEELKKYTVLVKVLGSYPKAGE